jgi:hypothetical protein
MDRSCLRRVVLRFTFDGFLLNLVFGVYIRSCWVNLT